MAPPTVKTPKGSFLRKTSRVLTSGAWDAVAGFSLTGHRQKLVDFASCFHKRQMSAAKAAKKATRKANRKSRCATYTQEDSLKACITDTDPKNHKTDKDDDENLLDGFRDVIEDLDLGKLEQAAAMVRLKRDFPKGKDLVLLNPLDMCCSISPIPKCGSYNLAYLVTFMDGVQWVARVPGHGHAGRWGELEKRKMDSEYSTMRYVRARTAIPIPDVFYWHSEYEYAGAPFALMEMVEGESLAELWTGTNMSHQQRLDVLASIAGYMCQMYNLSFDRLGMLEFDKRGKVTGVGEDIGFESDGFNPWHRTVAEGPYTTFMDYVWDLFGREADEDMTSRQRANIPILRRALKSIPDSLVSDRKFRLSFSDFNYQNILVDPSNYRIIGFIDWDRVHTDSASAGCARFPSWITRDWDPLMYEYQEGQDLGEGGTLFEESPETLSKYRQLYAAEFIKHASNFEGFDPQMIKLSHILEAICIALTSPLNRREIIDKLLLHAFDGKMPFRKADYVVDYMEGQRAEKDKLIEEAFAKMWHAEWEKPQMDKKEGDAMSGASSEDAAQSRSGTASLTTKDTEIEDHAESSEDLRNDVNDANGNEGKDGLEAGQEPGQEQDGEVSDDTEDDDNEAQEVQDREIDVNDRSRETSTEEAETIKSNGQKIDTHIETHNEDKEDEAEELQCRAMENDGGSNGASIDDAEEAENDGQESDDPIEAHEGSELPNNWTQRHDTNERKNRRKMKTLFKFEKSKGRGSIRSRVNAKGRKLQNIFSKKGSKKLAEDWLVDS